MSYALHLLGPFKVTDECGEAVRVRRPMQRLLAFLALRGRSEQRALVAATLWPDLPDRRSLANLRSVLWRCHRELPDSIEADNVTIRLTSDVWIDYLDGSSPDCWFEGLLPGWSEEWAELPRFLHRQTRLQLIEERAVELLVIGGRPATTTATGLLERLVDQEPLRQSACRLLSSAYLALEQADAAAAVGEEFRLRLQDRLGCRPTETVAWASPIELT